MLKKLLSGLALVWLAVAGYAAELPPLVLRDFTPGWQTDRDSSDICDSCAQDLENVDLSNGYIAKRRGSILQNSSTLGGFTTQPARFGHEYVDTSNNFNLLSISSNSLFYSRDAGVTNTILTSGLGITSNSRFAAVNAFGKAYLVDGATNCIVVSGISVSASTAVPKGPTIEFFAERILVAGVQGSPNTLYASAVGDAADFTQDTGLDDDAFSTNIREGFGYPIRKIKRWRNGVMIFTDKSLDFLTVASDGLTFVITPVSSRIGTTFPETVVASDNVLRFIASDGIYEFNGTTIQRISEKIQPSIEGLAQLNSFGRAYIETSQTSFQAGISSGVSANIVSDSLYLSTWTDTDTTAADFAAGTLTNVTTNTVSGSLYLSTTNTNFTNNTFAGAGGWTAHENGFGCGTNTTTSTAVSTYGFDDTCFYISNTYSSLPSSVTVRILDVNGSTLTYQSYNVNAGYTQESINLSSIYGRNVVLRVQGDNRNLISTDEFFTSGGTVSFYVRFSSGLVLGVPRYQISLDLFAGGRSTIFDGDFVSQIFDTQLSSAGWFTGAVSLTSNGHDFLFETRSSTDGVTFEAYQTWNTAVAPISSYRRYIQYKLTLSTASAGTGLPFLDFATLRARQTSGNYVGGYATLTGISSFGLFQAGADADSGSITYTIYTDSDTNRVVTNGIPAMSSVISSQTITSGQTISLSTNSYAFVTSTVSVTVTSQNPHIDDLSISWNEGNPSLFPSCIEFDQNMHCSMAFNSSTGNDTILIFDINRAFTKYTGLPASYLFLYRGKPYFGSGEKGDIVRYQADNYYTDYDSAAISSFWTSKDFDFGYPITQKTLLKFYVTGKYQLSSNVTFSYGVNRPTTLTSSTFSLDLTAGFFRRKITPASTTYSDGLQHRFKISDATNNGQMQILSISGWWNVLTNP